MPRRLRSQRKALKGKQIDAIAQTEGAVRTIKSGHLIAGWVNKPHQELEKTHKLAASRIELWVIITL